MVAAAGLLATPAPARLLNGVSIPERTELRRNVDVPPNAQDGHETVVLSVPITLQAGQSRRISDQLTVTLSSSGNPEVDHILECRDARGLEHGDQVGVAAASGTNHQGSGPLAMHASLLFTAPTTGTFICGIRANTSDGSNTRYHMTAIASPGQGRGTWLEIDNFTGDPPQWWQNPICNSKGDSPTCVYLGRPARVVNQPVTTTLYYPTVGHPGVGWIAPPDATSADLTAHMQITSCPIGTSSCHWYEWGGPTSDTRLRTPIDYGEAVFRTHLDFIQLDERNSPCSVTSTPDTQYSISNSVHHFLVDYTPPPVFISQTCGGSRRFALRAVVTWVYGNTVKIDAGSVFGFRSATNANVIVRSIRAVTTVPTVIGTDEGSVAGHLAAWGLTVGTVTRVVDPARPGTVIGQNSPGGTVEPQGSPVDLTISRGVVAVPSLDSLQLADATRELRALGLGVDISYQAACIYPGHVIGQSPSPGVLVAPGSTVRIIVDNGTHCGPLR